MFHNQTYTIMEKGFAFSYTDQFGFPHHVCGACEVLYSFRDDPKGVRITSLLVDGQAMTATKALIAEVESRVITGNSACKAPVVQPASNAKQVDLTAIIGVASLEGDLMLIDYTEETFPAL